MECDEVKQILDAYVLGALDKEEAKGLEEHVAECLRCWAELSEAQRAAAALALAAPLQAADISLRKRVLAAASRSQEESRLVNLVNGLRSLRPLGLGALAAVATAAVALSAVLFVQVDDLRQDNDQLQQQVDTAGRVTSQLRQMEAIRSAPDLASVQLTSIVAPPEATATFLWSESNGTGALVCNNLETLNGGQVYQIWLFKDGEAIAAGTFNSWDGVGHWVLDLRTLTPQDIDTIGVSIEPRTGSIAPSGQMVFRGTFPHDY